MASGSRLKQNIHWAQFVIENRYETLIINLIMNRFSLTIMAIYNPEKYFSTFQHKQHSAGLQTRNNFRSFKKKGLWHFTFWYRMTRSDRNQGVRIESLVKWKIDLNSNNNHNNKISNVQ